jgi:hypothetical protein
MRPRQDLFERPPAACLTPHGERPTSVEQGEADAQLAPPQQAPTNPVGPRRRRPASPLAALAEYNKRSTRETRTYRDSATRGAALEKMRLLGSAASARAAVAGRGGAAGGLVRDDDLGKLRIAGERREASGEAPPFILNRCDRADRVLGIRGRRRERGALPASSPEPARQPERRGEPAGARDHHAASATGA